MRVIVVNGFLALTATVLTVVSFELSPLGNDIYERFLYYSVNPWKTRHYKGDFFITLPPDTKIRTYAKYGDHIDYDVTFTTDSLGFRGKMGPIQKDDVISVVGDSFTMGSGGTVNWVGKLSDQSSDLSGFFFHNNGVGGTGVQHWRTLIDYMHDVRGVNRFVILMIERDLSRPKWYSSENKHGRISFCVKTKCHPMNIVTNTTMDHVDWRGSQNRHWPLQAFPKTYRAINNLRSYVIGKRAYIEQFNEFMQFLQSRDHSNFIVIQIPSKEDILLGGGNRYQLDHHIENVVYIERQCFRGLADFHVRDSHPNDEGYASLTRCVAELLARHVDMLAPASAP